ncbi:MAG: PilZ domain-containing protein [Bacillota bacterium]|nr:PilZ domain-containing protein [Bacillota bacterium]
MANIKFLINSRIEILEDDKVYKSIIQDLTDGYIAISLPVREGMYMTPSQGERLEVLYYDSLNVYKFETVVEARSIENNIHQLLLGYPQNVVIVQRRRFVRVDVAFYVNCARVDKKGNKIELSSQQPFKGIMLDISGGGFRISTDYRLSLHDTIVTEIPSDNGNIEVVGEVVRLERAIDGKYLCGISYVEISERIRDRIIQYIFTLMRKQRKNV